MSISFVCIRSHTEPIPQVGGATSTGMGQKDHSEHLNSKSCWLRCVWEHACTESSPPGACNTPPSYILYTEARLCIRTCAHICTYVCS